MHKFVRVGGSSKDRVKVVLKRMATVTAVLGVSALTIIANSVSDKAIVTKNYEEPAVTDLSDNDKDSGEDTLTEESDDDGAVPLQHIFARAASDYITVSVEADGSTFAVIAVPGCTVEEVLDRLGIEIQPDDVLSIDPDSVLSENTGVTVTRVSYVEQTREHTYSYETVYRDDETLPVGESEVIDSGSKGKMVITTRYKIVDGETVDSTVLSKEITVKATPKIIAMGCMEVGTPEYAAYADESENVTEVTEAVNADDSAEDSGEDEYLGEEDSGEEDHLGVWDVPADIDDSDDSEEWENIADLEDDEYFPEETETPVSTDIFEEPSETTAYTDELPAESEYEPVCLDGSKPISKLDFSDSYPLDENGIPVNSIAVHKGKACAYTAKPDAAMSTGRAVFQGYVAVDPDVIPYGSVLYIVADSGAVYGYAVAADTGYSVCNGEIIVDLFMDNYDDCIQWGRRDVTVYVLS